MAQKGFLLGFRNESTQLINPVGERTARVFNRAEYIFPAQLAAEFTGKIIVEIGINVVFLHEIAGDLLLFQIGEEGSKGRGRNTMAVNDLIPDQTILTAHGHIAVKLKIENLPQIRRSLGRAAGRNEQLYALLTQAAERSLGGVRHLMGLEAEQGAVNIEENGADHAVSSLENSICP